MTMNMLFLSKFALPVIHLTVDIDEPTGLVGHAVFSYMSNHNSTMKNESRPTDHKWTPKAVIF